MSEKRGSIGIRKIVDEMLESGKLKGFDDFIIRQMGMELSGNEEKDTPVRREAFLEFRRRSGQYPFASMPTMRRWFGIGGKAVPSRMLVYEMGLQMELGREKTELYLKEGIREPSFQINDYHEIIWLYGLENKSSIEGCNGLIQAYEEYMSSPERTGAGKTHTTNELWRQYEEAKGKLPEDFFIWMTDRADWFQGYSRTMQGYLEKLRKTILAEVRSEAKERLEILLGETEYDRWKRKYDHSGMEEKELIRRFLRYSRNSQNPVEESLLRTVRELYRLTYREWDSNVQLLSELYNNHESAKHLSDLFNIPQMKEKDMQIRFSLQILAQLEDDEECPGQIKELGTNLTRHEEWFDTAGNAKKALEAYLKENKRRNLIVQRTDLLPMVLQVAQTRYRKEHPEGYEQEAAREFFIDMAEKVLNVCNMAPVNEEYVQDYILLSCFRKNEMITYAELLDEMEKGEDEK